MTLPTECLCLELVWTPVCTRRGLLSCFIVSLFPNSCCHWGNVVVVFHYYLAYCNSLSHCLGSLDYKLCDHVHHVTMLLKCFVAGLVKLCLPQLLNSEAMKLNSVLIFFEYRKHEKICFSAICVSRKKKISDMVSLFGSFMRACTIQCCYLGLFYPYGWDSSLAVLLFWL